MWKEKTSSLEALCRLQRMRDEVRPPLHMDQPMRWLSELQMVPKLSIPTRPSNRLWFHSWCWHHAPPRWIAQPFFQLLHWHKNRDVSWAVVLSGAIVLNGDWAGFRRSGRPVPGCHMYAFFLFLLSRGFDQTRPYNQWESQDEPIALLPKKSHRVLWKVATNEIERRTVRAQRKLTESLRVSERLEGRQNQKRVGKHKRRFE